MGPPPRTAMDCTRDRRFRPRLPGRRPQRLDSFGAERTPLPRRLQEPVMRTPPAGAPIVTVHVLTARRRRPRCASPSVMTYAASVRYLRDFALIARAVDAQLARYRARTWSTASSPVVKCGRAPDRAQRGQPAQSARIDCPVSGSKSRSPAASTSSSSGVPCTARVRGLRRAHNTPASSIGRSPSSTTSRPSTRK
jgi:hypothetical protein